MYVGRTCKPHVIWQKPTQYCKAIILQLQINKCNYQKNTCGKPHRSSNYYIASDMSSKPSQGCASQHWKREACETDVEEKNE